MDRKVSGVILDTAITRETEERRRDDIHEIMWNEDVEEYNALEEENNVPEDSREADKKASGSIFDFDNIKIRSVHQLTIDEAEADETPEQFYSTLDLEPAAPDSLPRGNQSAVNPLTDPFG